MSLPLSAAALPQGCCHATCFGCCYVVMGIAVASLALSAVLKMLLHPDSKKMWWCINGVWPKDTKIRQKFWRTSSVRNGEENAQQRALTWSSNNSNILKSWKNEMVRNFKRKISGLKRKNSFHCSETTVSFLKMAWKHHGRLTLREDSLGQKMLPRSINFSLLQ